MGNMYDTLGDFLNKALEDGKIPEPKPKFSASKDYTFSEDVENNKTAQKNSNATVSLEDLPQSLKKAFITLHSLTDQSLKAVKKNYRELLKAAHPDTGSHISGQDKKNSKLSSITEIKAAYDVVEKYFLEKRDSETSSE